MRLRTCSLLLAGLLGAGLLSACASEVPVQSSFDSSAGEITIVVRPDGFVSWGGERIPLEAAVLRLRQRVRGMSDDAMAHFVVLLGDGSPGDDPAAQACVRRDVARLIGELQKMGVQQVGQAAKS